MRIISGLWKGRKLNAPKGFDVRPTSDKVKESIFNIIRNYVEGSLILDLFAGTGSLGLEALSRGASKAVFVESNFRAIHNLKLNCKTSPDDLYEVIAIDAFKAITRFRQESRRFDIIFLDPPYNLGIQSKMLDTLSQYDILNDDGIIVVEHDSKDTLFKNKSSYLMLTERTFGNIGLTIFRKGKPE